MRVPVLLLSLVGLVAGSALADPPLDCGDQATLAHAATPADAYAHVVAHMPAGGMLSLNIESPARDPRYAKFVALREDGGPWEMAWISSGAFGSVGTGGVPLVLAGTNALARIEVSGTSGGHLGGIGVVAAEDARLEILAAWSAPTSEAGSATACGEEGVILESLRIGQAIAFWPHAVHEGIAVHAYSIGSAGVADGSFTFGIAGDAVGVALDPPAAGAMSLAGPTGTRQILDTTDLTGAALGAHTLRLDGAVSADRPPALLLVDLPSG